MPIRIVLRAVLAAAVLLAADVHLQLWVEGVRDVALVGPMFLLHVVAGLAVAVAVLAWRHPLPLLAAAALELGTLAAFIVSATVGLLGVHETWAGTPQRTAALAEVVAVLTAAAALAVERVAPRPVGSGGVAHTRR